MFQHGRTRHDVITLNVARPGDREDRHVSRDPESLLTREERARRRALVADGEAIVEEFWDTKLWTTEGYAMRGVLTRAPFAPTGPLSPFEEEETT
jgi:hypothetical protein